MSPRKFTRQELSHYNGREGKPAFIACHGKVYDVSSSFLWKNGKHQALHEAGVDLTDALNDAPHGLDQIRKFPIIGILVES